MSKIPYFKVFPLFGVMICHMILFSKFLGYFLNEKQKLRYVFCAQTLIESTLFRN